MRYELVECNQFQANTFFDFNLGYEIKNGKQLCSKIDQNMFNAYSDKCTRKRVKMGDVKKWTWKREKFSWLLSKAGPSPETRLTHSARL